MDLERILAEIRAERELVEEAIIALERLARTKARRGRMPIWLKAVKAEAKKEMSKKLPA